MANEAKESDSAGRTARMEAEVWNAISAFEQILEAMPEDRTSLEALAGAYAQIGDHARARDYLIRLADVVVGGGDAAAAGELAGRLRPLEGGDERVAALVARLDALGAGGGGGAAPESGTAAQPGREEILARLRRGGFNMAEAISFAWELMEAGELSESEYAKVVQDLTEMSVGGDTATVSVLHVLEARGSKSLDRVLAYCAREHGTAVVALSGFDLQYAIVTLLPQDVTVRCGALVFELLGDDALVVLMNPYDAGLRADLETLVGKRCHFFLALPSEFDQALERVGTLIEEHNLEQGE
ncbi:MAG: hypothetical protein JW951_01740 [Lentisphaerae bacterium]|nr:hypothetical protein [Lentisphaerota bacterium]